MSDDLVKRLREAFVDLDDLNDAADRIEELEAKLEVAVEALFEAIYLLDPNEEDILKGAGLYRIVTTFKELKGETNE